MNEVIVSDDSSHYENEFYNFQDFLDDRVIWEGRLVSQKEYRKLLSNWMNEDIEVRGN